MCNAILMFRTANEVFLVNDLYTNMRLLLAKNIIQHQIKIRFFYINIIYCFIDELTKVKG